MRPMRPFFSYYGAKWRQAALLPVPTHDTIVEPFAGSAGYATRYGAGRRVVLVERDPVVASVWRWLLAARPADVLALPDVPDGGTVADLGLEPGAAALVGFWINKGTASPCVRPSAWMRSEPGSAQFWGADVRQRIAAQLPGIAAWALIEGDYSDAPPIVATWHVDPPYQQAGRHYRYGSARLDYAALGAWCRTLRGQVMVCENAGADWLPFEPFAAMKATCGVHKAGGGRYSEEVVWPAREPYGQRRLF